MKNKMSFKQKMPLVLSGLILILVLLELFLRLYPAFGYNYHFFRFKSKESALGNMDYYMRPSPLLGYEHIPDVESRINSYGLIGKKYKIEKDKDIFRILLLGDSIAEQGHSAEFLEADLNDKSKLSSNYTFEVWNAGVASYDVRRYALYLMHKGLKYTPDMVIVFLFMNDFHSNLNIYYKTKRGLVEYEFPISEISKRYIPSPFFMKHSFLYRFIILRLDSFLIGKKKNQGIDLEEVNGRYYLRMIKEICQRNNISLFIVIFSYLKPLDEYESVQMDEYLTICKVVKDSNVPHLNLYNLYDQLLKESFPLRDKEDDEIHPSKEGHKIIAERVFYYISKSLK